MKRWIGAAAVLTVFMVSAVASAGTPDRQDWREEARKKAAEEKKQSVQIHSREKAAVHRQPAGNAQAGEVRRPGAGPVGAEARIQPLARWGSEWDRDGDGKRDEDRRDGHKRGDGGKRDGDKRDDGDKRVFTKRGDSGKRDSDKRDDGGKRVFTNKRGDGDNHDGDKRGDDKWRFGRDNNRDGDRRDDGDKRVYTKRGDRDGDRHWRDGDRHWGDGWRDWGRDDRRDHARYWSHDRNRYHGWDGHWYHRWYRNWDRDYDDAWRWRRAWSDWEWFTGYRLLNLALYHSDWNDDRIVFSSFDSDDDRYFRDFGHKYGRWHHRERMFRHGDHGWGYYWFNRDRVICVFVRDDGRHSTYFWHRDESRRQAIRLGLLAVDALEDIDRYDGDLPDHLKRSYIRDVLWILADRR